MQSIRARVWANPETNESHAGIEFIGTITSMTTTSFAGTKDTGKSFSCIKRFWYYEKLNEGFSKVGLKDGMIVEVANGNFYLVLGDRCVGKDGHTKMRNYREDLTNRYGDGDYDIVAVYNSTEPFNVYVIFDRKNLKEVWKRKPNQLEIQNIEKQMRDLAVKQDQLADQLAKLNNNY